MTLYSGATQNGAREERFSLKGTDPRPLFAFLDIWRKYNGPVKREGPNIEIETYFVPDHDVELARLAA